MPVRGKTGTVKRINRSMLEHKYLAWRNSTWMQSWAQVFGNRAILQSDGDKPPKGFEKFFKNRKNKDAKESSANDDKKEEEKQAEPAEKEAEDSKGFGDTKGEESGKDSGESYGDMFRNKVQGFFFDPQMDPRPENWIALVAMFGLIYYIINYREPRKEIV